MTGVIDRFIVGRGFGFIVPDDGDSRGDHFFHVRNLPPELPQDESLIGLKVEFTSQLGPKGLNAANIHLLSEVS